tara:strand:- start:777 stop:1802 length:1026 start_codon:yes stop_codon:yes gene_type:complete
MTFFNKKTEVMQIEMTPYGRYLYSIGKFKPHFYEFVDDDIMYGVVGSQESTEGQGTAHKRITEETPKLKINRAFQEEAAEFQSPSNTSPFIISKQRIVDKKMDQKQNGLFSLGRSSYSSDNAATLQASMIQGRISASFMNHTTDRVVASAGLDRGGRILIPQVNIEYNIIATKRNELEESSFSYEATSETLSNGDYISLNHQPPIIHLKEFNSFYEKENFEIEVFLEEANGSLKPLKFKKEYKSLVNDLMVDPPEGQQELYNSVDLAPGNHNELPEDFAIHYFSIEIDEEIPVEDLCKAIDKLEITSQFLDEELICPDQRTSRFDIYSTRVDPSDLEDCDK